MRTIEVFFRNRDAGFSIEKVTRTYLNGLYEDYNISVKYLPCCGASIKSIVRNLLYVFHKRGKNSINHITGDTHYALMSLIGAKSVLTIHDIDTYGMRNTQNKLKKYLIELLWIRVPLLIADRVICISEETKREVMQYTRRSDIMVIHNAIDPIFKTNEDYNPVNNRILVIGTNANKNLESTIKALEGLNCEMRIIGKLNESQMRLLIECKINYSNQYNLSDMEIVREYEDAGIVSFCSLYEGFGMPIIEANAVGRPVICSDLPVLREVAADSAIFVNPKDVREMHSAYQKLLTDIDLRYTLISKGFRNVSRFSVDSITERWKDIYNSI